MAAKINESLVKYLAGLLDADGSLSFTFKKYEKAEDTYFIGITLGLTASDAVDREGFVENLPAQTGMGGVYRYGDEKQFVSWRISRRAQLEMLLPRLIKHMVIKAQHWQWILDVWRSRRGSNFSATEVEALKAESKHSRATKVGPLKPKNHPTWAWLAGYLDGDGWYRLSYQKPPHNYWQINVGAGCHINDVSALEFIQQAFGGRVWRQETDGNVMVWRRNLGVRDASFALRFLPKVVRHARLKRHKIEQMIRFHRQRLSAQSSTE